MSNRFLLGMNVDTYSPDEICDGWEFVEIPMGIHLDPLMPNHLYEKYRQLYLRKDIPPVIAASHYFNGPLTDVVAEPWDNDMIKFMSRRGFARMAELGVKFIGVYGASFKYRDGMSKTKVRDRTLEVLNMVADASRDSGVPVGIEPMGNPDTVFVSYADGLEILKELGRPEMKIMADLNYFLAIDEALETILEAPEDCLHVHIQGDGGAQPNVGQRDSILLHLFEVLKKANYQHGVSAACPWQSTLGDELDIMKETQITLDYLKGLRDKVYG